MNKTTLRKVPIHLAAVIATAGALLHIAAVFGGPAWYVFFGAPPAVVASAQAGTWLAPASAIVIAVLMGICALYACSASGLVGRLPLLRMVLAAIASICLLRALILLPLAMVHPKVLTPFEIISALVWGSAGYGFAVALSTARPPRPTPGVRSDIRTRTRL